MTGFFHSAAADWQSVDEVASISPAAEGLGGLRFYNVHLSNRTLRLTDLELDDLLHRPVQIMPAEPGTRIVHYSLDGSPEHWTSPTIGWALCVDGVVRPMTSGGPVCHDSEYPHGVFVQMADGSVGGVGPGASDFEDADQMLRFLVKRAAVDVADAELGGSA